jgi:hypothetical protein
MNKYTLIRVISGRMDTDGNIYAVLTSEIKQGPLSDVYSEYGQQWGDDADGEGIYYTFWSGSNYKSIVFWDEFGNDYQYEIIDDDKLTEKISEDFKKAEFIEEKFGIRYFQGELHKYSVSRWQNNPWDFEVED